MVDRDIGVNLGLLERTPVEAGPRKPQGRSWDAPMPIPRDDPYLNVPAAVAPLG